MYFTWILYLEILVRSCDALLLLYIVCASRTIRVAQGSRQTTEDLIDTLGRDLLAELLEQSGQSGAIGLSPLHFFCHL
ncbi:hypothetical protein IWW34DRAFT_722342 [Fusarium oxysporum f. sp. albedinis]|jgi:hypothetical protein|nr:hypothetical protein BKA60DRAFT_572193 [Fusarium oxysporum]KAI3584419.1 hypothetical protein IWW34DRAFT_722342 [Fusarium oxysporum f. sp. albedinis]